MLGFSFRLLRPGGSETEAWTDRTPCEIVSGETGNRGKLGSVRISTRRERLGWEGEKKGRKGFTRARRTIYCSHDITKAEAAKKKKEDAPSSARSREQEQTHRNSAPFAAWGNPATPRRLPAGRGPQPLLASELILLLLAGPGQHSEHNSVSGSRGLKESTTQTKRTNILKFGCRNWRQPRPTPCRRQRRPIFRAPLSAARPLPGSTAAQHPGASCFLLSQTDLNDRLTQKEPKKHG